MATYPRRQTPPRQLKHYDRYRARVREDFNGYCAYCGVHESEWPHSQKNYQQDHFKPKGLKKFEHLKNDFYNLRWCCHICNRIDAKGDNWPTPEEEEAGIGFVDLCEDDWQQHYDIQPDGTLTAKSAKAEYTIEIIGLNEPDYVEHRLAIRERGHSIFAPAALPTLP